MDFGVVGLEGGGLVCSADNAELAISALASSNASAAEANKQKWYNRSGFLKQERSGTNIEDDWRDFKVTKTSDDFSASKAMLLQQKSSLLRSNSNTLLSEGQQQQMLSFSSPNSQTVTLPYYTSTAYSRNAGYGSGGLNAGSMHGVLSGFRGPFAPSQWMELELQALIYKYITSNIPIPSYLLNPIRKALDSAGFSSFPGLRPNTLGWGAFHLGFSNNTDPEPGRCRRTDGKKWRCSRDAVADQKYCERHINRGRHRSRKPVEGQPGHSVSGTTSSTSKPPVASTTPGGAVPGGGASNSLTHNQVNSLQPGGTNPSSASHHFDRNLLDKANVGERYQDTRNLSILSPSISLKDQYSIPKQKNPSEESSRAEFGIVCSDSLLNPLNKSSSLINCRNNGTAEGLNDSDSKSQHPLRQFMDDWPRNRSESSAISWSNIDVHSDRTQLSISTPIATSDYVSATSSPNNEKLATSPLRLLPELEATQMGLGVGTVVNEQSNRQANWIPVSWQSSMGGPLGEVLHSTNNGTGDSTNTSALNLMTEGWDSSPRMASSPTGVLQKAAYGSLSNSSAGSSPRPENSKTREGATLCNGFLGTTLQNPTLPAL